MNKKLSPSSSSINKGNPHGIMNVEIELNNTLNRIEFDYVIQRTIHCLLDKLTMKTEAQSTKSCQCVDSAKSFYIVWLFNPCSVSLRLNCKS